MFTSLSKKLNGLTELKPFDPHINELAALLIDEKGVIFTSFKSVNKSYIEKLCHTFKLKTFTRS